MEILIVLIILSTFYLYVRFKKKKKSISHSGDDKKGVDKSFSIIDGKVNIPLFTFEPLDFLESSKLSLDEFNSKGFKKYFYDLGERSGDLLDGLFENITFRVFSDEKNINSNSPSINLDLTTQSVLILSPSEWKNFKSDNLILTIERISEFINQLNDVFQDNDPFTDVDFMRISSGSWRGRSYQVDKDGKVGGSGMMIFFHLDDDNKFTFSITGYHPYILLKRNPSEK
jgi:hypothetical protein